MTKRIVLPEYIPSRLDPFMVIGALTRLVTLMILQRCRE